MDTKNGRRFYIASASAFLFLLAAATVVYYQHQGLALNYDQVKASSYSAEIRCKAAHASALAEAENGKESFEKALATEKECLANIEKSKHEMREESAETKVLSESKLVEAHSILNNAQKKFAEAEAKFRRAESLEAEASRYHRIAERKLNKVEEREDDLRKRTILFKSECDDREKQTSLEKQSLCERRKLFRLDEEVQLSQRERYINGRQQELSQLEKTLEESKAKIETELKIMNKDKTDLKLKLDALSTREEAVCKKEAMLDKKEAELLFTQEKLARREHDEIQKLVAKLQASLEVKKFESEEIEHRRIAMQNEMDTKRRACELKELDLRQSEEFLQEKEMEFDVSLEKNKEERNRAALVSTKKGFFDHLKDAADLATETIILSKGCCVTEPCPFDEYIRCKERISRHLEKLAALPYVFYIPYCLLLYIPHALLHPLPQRE